MAQINLTADSELIKGLFSANGRDEVAGSFIILVITSEVICTIVQIGPFIIIYLR